MAEQKCPYCGGKRGFEIVPLVGSGLKEISVAQCSLCGVPFTVVQTLHQEKLESLINRMETLILELTETVKKE